MNISNNLQSNNCAKSVLSYSEFINFDNAVTLQRMEQEDCEWGWFCTAEDDHSPNVIHPVMNYTHKKSPRPIIAKERCDLYANAVPIIQPNIKMSRNELKEAKESSILSNKLFYYLSHCAIFGVIVLISTYS